MSDSTLDALFAVERSRLIGWARRQLVKAQRLRAQAVARRRQLRRLTAGAVAA